MSAEQAALSPASAVPADEPLFAAAQQLAAAPQTKFDELMAAAGHAVSARQQGAAVLLLNGAERFLSPDPVFLTGFIVQLTSLLGTCWREKMDEAAGKAISLALEGLERLQEPCGQETLAAAAELAQRAGRFALARRNDALFEQVAGKVSVWLAGQCDGKAAGYMLPAMEAWLHRIVRHERTAAVPAVFDSLQVLLAAETDKLAFLDGFLREWRFAVATAGLKPGNPLAVQLMEQLLLWALQADNRSFWPSVIRSAGEAAAFAATRHGVTGGFFLVRPLLDVGRVSLSDELKFGAGEEPDSLRQLLVRLICVQVLRIANLAARGDIMAVAGDKIEELYKAWVGLPESEPHRRSICRFCQMLLIVWAQHFRRAAKKWAPRETELAEPLLLSGEDQAKLAFLL